MPNSNDFSDLISEADSIIAQKRGITSDGADFYYYNGRIYNKYYAEKLMANDFIYKKGWTPAHYQRKQSFVNWLKFLNETVTP